MSADHVMDQLGLFWFGMSLAMGFRFRVGESLAFVCGGGRVNVSPWICVCVCLCLCRVKKRDAYILLFPVWNRRSSYAKTSVLSRENTKNPSLGMGSKFQVSSFRFQVGESHEHLFVEAGLWMWIQGSVCLCADTDMGWLRSVGSIKLEVSFAEYCRFCRTLL